MTVKIDLYLFLTSCSVNFFFQEKTNLLSTESPHDRDNRSYEIQDVEHNHKTRSQTHPPYDDEFKIILLGATGSGKSQLGNVLLQKMDTKEGGFETSCYAKSKTKQSILKSVTKTVKRNNVSKTYKIDIIDTPAISDTGLEHQEVEQEIEKAKLLSVPGPHAFLMCIPATAVTNYFTDEYALYEKHFRGRLRSSTIIVYTRCDQYESENNKAFDSKRVIEQNSFLKKMNNQISVNTDNNKILEEVIDIIIKIEKQNMWFWRFRSWF